MTRKTSNRQKSTSKDQGPKSKSRGEASAPEASASRMPSPAAIRETVESVVVAFVLAFLFRTFEAEAFVIPTGSMAPTLMGRHKDVEGCPICGSEFQVSASDRFDSATGAEKGPGFAVVDCICPNCRFPIDVGENNPQDEDYPSYKGDRILVSKFAYQFGDPDRWDVAVFKYPGGAKTNFIKRLVGLPGETIRIENGDIFVRPTHEPEAAFEIARKPAEKMLAMLQPVFDNDVTPKISEYGWAPRWQTDEGDEGWLTEDSRSFRTDGTHTADTWIRYRHLVPSIRQWQQVVDHPNQQHRPVEPQLISDFNPYNTGLQAQELSRGFELDSQGLHWVGDLALSCTMETSGDAGEAVLELVEAGRRMQCRIDLKTGSARLFIEGLDDFHPVAETAVRGTGKHKVMFSNIDDELRLWVDDELIEFDVPTAYGPLPGVGPTKADLSPVGVCAAGGAALQVDHLKIFRDIYYISVGGRGGPQSVDPLTDFTSPRFAFEALRNPLFWDENRKNLPAEFSLEADQFLALGDNSAKSKDGRLWPLEHYDHFVDRRLMIGKALYIYWPHSKDKLPGTNIPFPFFPNFGRMGLVR